MALLASYVENCDDRKTFCVPVQAANRLDARTHSIPRFLCYTRANGQLFEKCRPNVAKSQFGSRSNHSSTRKLFRMTECISTPENAVIQALRLSTIIEKVLKKVTKNYQRTLSISSIIEGVRFSVKIKINIFDLQVGFRYRDVSRHLHSPTHKSDYLKRAVLKLHFPSGNISTRNRLVCGEDLRQTVSLNATLLVHILTVQSSSDFV